MNKSENCHIGAVASIEKFCIFKSNLLRIGSQSFVYLLAVTIAMAMAWLLPAIYMGANGEQMLAQHVSGGKANSIMVASAKADKLSAHFSFGKTTSLHEADLLADR